MRIGAVLLVALGVATIASARLMAPEEQDGAMEPVNEAQPSSTGATEAAEEVLRRQREEEAAQEEREQELAAEASPGVTGATGAQATGAAGMEDEEDEEEAEEREEERERPELVPYGKNFVIFVLQLEGMSAQDAKANELKFVESIVALFDRNMGVAADHVAIEAVGELMPKAQADEEAVALLELGGEQLTSSLRVRVTVDADRVGDALTEIESMGTGELTAELAKRGLHAQVSLRGEPEVVKEPQGPAETGGAGGATVSIATTAAVALAALAQRRW